MAMKLAASSCTLVLLCGRASKSANVAPSCVSQLQYQSYDCNQLTAEAERVSARASVAAGTQDKKPTNDVVATTVGTVILWPVLFAVDGNDEHTAELARLKGEMKAIEHAAIQKDCGIAFQRPPARSLDQPVRKPSTYKSAKFG